MNTSSVNGSSSPAPVVMTDSQAETLLSALKLIHTVVAPKGSVGEGEHDLPAFAECNADNYSRALLDRARRGLEVYREARFESEMASIRVAVRGVVDAKTASARKLIAQAESAPAEMREIVLKAIGSCIYIPVSDFLGAFPKGTNLEDAKARLKKLGLELAKGAATDSGPRVKITLVPEAPPMPVNGKTERASSPSLTA